MSALFTVTWSRLVNVVLDVGETVFAVVPRIVYSDVSSVQESTVPALQTTAIHAITHARHARPRTICAILAAVECVMVCTRLLCGLFGVGQEKKRDYNEKKKSSQSCTQRREEQKAGSSTVISAIKGNSQSKTHFSIKGNCLISHTKRGFISWFHDKDTSAIKGN